MLRSQFFNRPWLLPQAPLESLAREMVHPAPAGMGLLSPAPQYEGAAAGRAHREALETWAAQAKPLRAGSAKGKGIGVIPVRGTITHRSLWMGTSVEFLRAALGQLLADDDVGAIVLDVDSGGGTVDGVPELGAEILAARGRKPIAAIANTAMGSAAYWLGSAADQVWITPSGEAGSIGVWALHVDFSKALEQFGEKWTFIHAGKFKIEGNPTEPLGDEAQAFLQQQVDATYAQFVAHVAAARGIKPAEVRGGMGQGRMLNAAQAKAEGLVDRIGTRAELLAHLGGPAAPAEPKPAQPPAARTASTQPARAWLDLRK